VKYLSEGGNCGTVIWKLCYHYPRYKGEERAIFAERDWPRERNYATKPRAWASYATKPVSSLCKRRRKSVFCGTSFAPVSELRNEAKSGRSGVLKQQTQRRKWLNRTAQTRDLKKRTHAKANYSILNVFGWLGCADFRDARSIEAARKPPRCQEWPPYEKGRQRASENVRNSIGGAVLRHTRSRQY